MEEVSINQIEFCQVSDRDRLLSIIEGLLFTSGDRLKLKDIAEIIESTEIKTKNLLLQLREEYLKEERGIELIISNNEYYLAAKRKNNSYIQKLLKINYRQSLSQASIETLSIIAYKQPITRVEIEEIRGVKSDSAVNTLLQKGLITEKGRLDVIGRPIVYATTGDFLTYFGLNSLKDLPNISEFEEEIE